MADKNKPKLVKYEDNEWEFVFPPSIESEEVEEKFFFSVEQLGKNDLVAETILKSLIYKNPFHLDAYAHLSIAFKNQEKTFESFLTAEKAYNLGKSLLPKKFAPQKDTLPWGYLDNRPFLRVCHTLGLEYQHRKEYQKAIDIYSEILQYNSGDNQGVRYLLLECLFLLKDYQKAEEFINKYPNDWSIDFLYGKLIIEILKDNKDVKTLLDEAIECNEFLPKEIIKTKHKAPPAGKFDEFGIVRGSVQEAFEYWSRNKNLYKNKKIIDFFKNNI